MSQSGRNYDESNPCLLLSLKEKTPRKLLKKKKSNFSKSVKGERSWQKFKDFSKRYWLPQGEDSFLFLVLKFRRNNSLEGCTTQRSGNNFLVNKKFEKNGHFLDELI